MFDHSTLFRNLTLFLCLASLGVLTGFVERPLSQQDQEFRRSSPRQESRSHVPRHESPGVEPPGTGLPPSTKPSTPPSFGSPAVRTPAPTASRSNSSLSTPSDPEQVPVSGLGWLAAAGAAYGISRLRSKGESLTSIEF